MDADVPQRPRICRLSRFFSAFPHRRASSSVGKSICFQRFNCFFQHAYFRSCDVGLLCGKLAIFYHQGDSHEGGCRQESAVHDAHFDRVHVWCFVQMHIAGAYRLACLALCPKFFDCRNRSVPLLSVQKSRSRKCLVAVKIVRCAICPNRFFALRHSWIARSIHV